MPAGTGSVMPATWRASASSEAPARANPVLPIDPAPEKPNVAPVAGIEDAAKVGDGGRDRAHAAPAPPLGLAEGRTASTRSAAPRIAADALRRGVGEAAGVADRSEVARDCGIGRGARRHLGDGIERSAQAVGMRSGTAHARPAAKHRRSSGTQGRQAP